MWEILLFSSYLNYRIVLFIIELGKPSVWTRPYGNYSYKNNSGSERTFIYKSITHPEFHISFYTRVWITTWIKKRKKRQDLESDQWAHLCSLDKLYSSKLKILDFLENILRVSINKNARLDSLQGLYSY